MVQTNTGRVAIRALLILAMVISSMGGMVQSAYAAPATAPAGRGVTSERPPLAQEPFGMAETIIEGETAPPVEDPGVVVPVPDLWDVPPPQPVGDDVSFDPNRVGGAALDDVEVAAEESEDSGAAGIAQAFAPELAAPVTGAVITGASDPPTGVPTLHWHAAPNADYYQVQISASPGFPSNSMSTNTYALSYTPQEALADGPYYWRVRSRSGRTWSDYSETWSFTKDWSDNGDLRPVLLAPANNSELANFAADHFSWEPLPGAASYVLEIATDDQFVDPVYTDTTIKPHHTPDTRLANSPYFWRVVPQDARGHRGAPSEIWRFTYLWDAPPQLLAPADDLITPFLPQFSWSPVEGARRYQLEISTQDDLTDATIYVTANTDFTPEKGLSNDQDYFWRVKAIDANNVSTTYSEIRKFEMEWNFKPQLLTPANNAIMLSFPHFTWTPVPGAERYEIIIAPNRPLQAPIGKVQVYNVTAYTQLDWREAHLATDYFWQVQPIDAQGNYGTPSDIYAFQIYTQTGPNLIYPLPYYTPDAENLPVHEDRTIAWPLFLWNSAHDQPLTRPEGVPPARNAPDFYRLTVSEQPDFSVVNFQIDTAGLAAAPTLDQPFNGLEDGKLYYWRVRAMRNGAQLGVDVRWETRYDAQANPYPVVDTMQIMHPAAGSEAVEVAPVLGWLPVTDAHHYRVEVSLDREFIEIVDEAQAQFIYYVPWQDRHEEIPMGTYWWRVRAEDDNNNPLTEWSETRHFNLSQEGIMGNPHDFPVPDAGIAQSNADYNADLTRLAINEVAPLNPDHTLGALHMMPDRSHSLLGQSTPNYNWITAFQVAPMISETVQYGIYIDSTHDETTGATVDPLGKPIAVDPLYKPDYAIYVTRSPENELVAYYYRWLGTTWDTQVELGNMGGAVWLEPATNALHVRVSYTALGTTTDQYKGSLAVAVFSTAADPGVGMLASVPTQPGDAITRPAFISDMLMPLYPFDTPLWNPHVQHEPPSLHWRMPYFNSVDGYEVQVALDDAFTEMRELPKETYETGTSSFFSLLPATQQSRIAYSDNESIFWRVRMRYERYNHSTDYERSSWSRPMRYKLNSFTVGNPLATSNARLDDAVDAEMVVNGLAVRSTLTDTVTDTLVVQSSPTFSWDRVEGASGYRLWVSQDANFSKRVIDKQLDGVSYTPLDALPDGTYYWMVAPRRSRTVFGAWSPVYTFVKQSVAPVPVAPIADAVINEHPTFIWEPLYFDTAELRLATSRYRLQISDDINFSNPNTFDTQSTSFTLSKGNTMRRTKLTDGTWYWRVAAIDANGNVGTYSPIQQFQKLYLQPVLVSPAQGTPEDGGAEPSQETLLDVPGGIPSFVWEPVPGAAYYEICIANTAQELDGACAARTDNTRYTPVTNLTETNYFWRVQMFDADGVAGPTVDGSAVIPKNDQLPGLFIPTVTRR